MLKNNLPKASVIIPVYNAENTLHYCIDSILKQTYKNFEIILINDGSRDKSLNIIKEYKKRYPDKIQIYDQPNQGVAETRNRGIKYSRGKYLFFVDNDDYIDNNYIETFIDSIEKTSADVVIGGYRRVKPDGKIEYERKTNNSEWFKFTTLTPWARVYKKSSLLKNNLKFLEANIGEDVYLNILANLSLNISIIEYIGYNWVNRKTSTSNTLHKGLNKSVEIFPMLNAIRNDTKNLKLNEQNREFLEYFFIKTVIFYVLYSGRGVKYEFIKNINSKLFKWLTQNYPNYKRNKQIRITRPQGERFTTRFIICFYILLQNLKIEKPFLFLYSLIK